MTYQAKPKPRRVLNLMVTDRDCITVSNAWRPEKQSEAHRRGASEGPHDDRTTVEPAKVEGEVSPRRLMEMEMFGVRSDAAGAR